MAHTDVKNIGVLKPGVNGGIWRYKQSSGLMLPTDAFSVRPGGSIRLGGVSDEGYTYTSERQVEKKKDWNGDKVRSVQQSKDDSFEVTFIEFFNPNLLSVAHGDNNVTVVPASASHGTQISIKDNADVLEHSAYIIDTLDGGTKVRRCIPDAQVSKIDPIVEKPGDWSVHKLTFDLFPDSQGNTNYRYIELDDKIVPSTWDVAVTGSAGTIVWGVDAQTTSAQAYNVTTTALKTALEALSTVGAGNATVTGAAGSAYHVVLANGGVLTAVGSGGATAVVTPA